jgi:hypothetical protein
MCGGIRFNYDPALEPALGEVFTAAQLAQFRASGLVTTLFWQPRPVLPALSASGLVLYDWGNREPGVNLPQTGWIRAESLTAGKWRHLRPQEVVIPAAQGVEKKVWFGITHGIRGFVVTRGDLQRLYMLTLPPTAEYLALTGHERMPALVEQETVVALA